MTAVSQGRASAAVCAKQGPRCRVRQGAPSKQAKISRRQVHCRAEVRDALYALRLRDGEGARGAALARGRQHAPQREHVVLGAHGQRAAQRLRGRGAARRDRPREGRDGPRGSTEATARCSATCAARNVHDARQTPVRVVGLCVHRARGGCPMGRVHGHTMMGLRVSVLRLLLPPGSSARKKTS